MRRLLFLLAALLAPVEVFGLEHVTLRKDGAEQRISGELLVTAEDGGLLVMAADGVLWAVEPQDIVERKHDTEPFRPFAAEELGKRLLRELPAGFEVHSTAHYSICYNTSREYANWCGALFERLYRGFTNYWSRKGLDLQEPRMPLVAIIFSDREAYVKFAKAELGAGAESIVGYYSLRTNRITMYDLTGVDALRGRGERRSSSAQINALLARPEAEYTVATIVHEATHQIAYNSGMQTRFADIPLWVSEGLAVYFETPDLQSAKGWRNIGGVNYGRLERFREYLGARPAGSLQTLLADDKRMRDPRGVLDGYAEAWALNYYLIRQHPKQYVAYMKVLAAKKPMVWDDHATRLKEFQAAFGAAPAELDADFLRQMQKVR